MFSTLAHFSALAYGRERAPSSEADAIDITVLAPSKK